MISTRTKVWFFLLLLCFSFLAIGQRLGDRTGLLLGFLLAIVVNSLVFFWGDTRILRAVQATELKGRDPWSLNERVLHLSKKLACEPARVYLMESKTPTAFSMGFSVRRPSVCISTALLEKFSSKDVEVVLAQQLCHMSRTDSLGFGVASVLANSLLGIAQAIDQLWPPNFFLSKNQKPFLSLASIPTWLILRGVANRSAYGEDDREAAALIQDRERLGEVLWRLDGYAQARPLEIPPATGHLFIVNPEGFQQRNYFLRLHPPMAERLSLLIGTPTV